MSRPWLTIIGIGDNGIDGPNGGVLELDESIRTATERYRYMDHCVVLGRGFNYSTAYEWSLKLKEMTYVVAAPYSSADFRHGPVAIVSDGFPVLAVAPRGAVLENVTALLRKLAQEHRAEHKLRDRDEEVAVSHERVGIQAQRPDVGKSAALPEPVEEAAQRRLREDEEDDEGRDPDQISIDSHGSRGEISV